MVLPAGSFGKLVWISLGLRLSPGRAHNGEELVTPAGSGGSGDGGLSRWEMLAALPCRHISCYVFGTDHGPDQQG
eukprot:10778710-Alexandrium_andersonii.AAC.1